MTDEKRNGEMVSNLKKSGYIHSNKVEQAFIHTFRELFVPSIRKEHAYLDIPLEIGNGQTISAPHMVAIMAEALDIQPGQNILEVGAGSGYHAAIIAYLTGEHGQVYSIERLPFLADFARKNLRQAGIMNVFVFEGDGSLGFQQHAPYDRIYVTCAAPSIPPTLTEQLAENGKLLIPVGRFLCELELIEKKGGACITKDLGGCAFVPLIGRYGYKS